MERSEVRRLLREVELRGDVRANAIFTLLLCTGCRVSDAVDLELSDLILSERSGMVVFRNGKGSKQRSVPLPLMARRAITAYLESRPPVQSNKVFLGERGPLTERGFRALCDKYSAIIGIKTSSPFAAAHDGPSVPGRQRERLGGPGPNPGSRKPEHDGPLHEADGAATWRGDGPAELLTSQKGSSHELVSQRPCTYRHGSIVHLLGYRDASMPAGRRWRYAGTSGIARRQHRSFV